MHDQLPRTALELVVSYRGIRRFIGAIGLLLPVVLFLGGWILGVEVQDTMSDYYHTPLRDYFVGSLFALGALLISYRGYTRVESWTANVAAAMAICLALFPLDAESDLLHQRSIAGYVHTFSGGVFFLALGFYSFHLFPRSGGGLLDRQRRVIYRTTGMVLLFSVAVMGGLIVLARGQGREVMSDHNLLFWLEWLAVWAFSVAWLTKGRMIVTEIAAELLAWPMHVLDRLSSATRDGK